jgi:biopolymer transport protein ExbD
MPVASSRSAVVSIDMSEIRADGSAKHQSVVTVMDVVGQLGFVKINLATVTPPDA